MRFANSFLHAVSAILWASSAESASKSMVMNLPIRTLEALVIPILGSPLATAFPWGSNNPLSGKISIWATNFTIQTYIKIPKKSCILQG